VVACTQKALQTGEEGTGGGGRGNDYFRHALRPVAGRGDRTKRGEGVTRGRQGLEIRKRRSERKKESQIRAKKEGDADLIIRGKPVSLVTRSSTSKREVRAIKAQKRKTSEQEPLLAKAEEQRLTSAQRGGGRSTGKTK